MRISLKMSLFSVLAPVVAALVFAAPALAGEFGLQSAAVSALNQNGMPDVQAGSHPTELVTSFMLPTERSTSGKKFFRVAGGNLKDVRLELPPGFVGDPSATPKCNEQEFNETAECPNDTAVGYALTLEAKPEEETPPTMFYFYDPVYNIDPPVGVPAQFAFNVGGDGKIWLNTTVRAGGDYGLTVTASNITQTLPIAGSGVTIWGVPAEESHNPYRGSCIPLILGQEVPISQIGALKPESICSVSAGVPAVPLLTNPTSCGTPRTGSLSVDSWQNPGHFVKEEISLPELHGCEKLTFNSSLTVAPDGMFASTPTGLNVEEQVPQESVLNPKGLAEADVKNTTVTLPAGVQLSPSAADGLQACTGDPADAPGTPGNEIGFTGVNPVSGVDEFTPRKPGGAAATLAGEVEPLQPGVNFCPNAAKIATVHIKTPLLEEELEGSVYLAAPQNFQGGPLENPFSSLLALYLVAEAPERGVLVKLAGKVVPNLQTGQLTTIFQNTPQLPYSELKLEFYGTDRAPLATPALCGTYGSEALIEPWSTPPGGASSPPGGTPSSSAAYLSSDFQIEQGPNGAPCSDPLPFSPSLVSDMTNIQAGAFSPLATTFSREDGQQSLSSVQLHYPAGLSGILSGVKLCGEAQANAGTCGPESEIGETIVSVGLGNDPFSVTGGKVFITEKYEGAPFGLSIVNPAKAGPFVLQEGRPVVVRAKIEVNPITAALTVTTNTEAQGYAIPHIIDGIPLQIKHVYVNVNRPGFTFNPTNCTPTAITGTIDSVEGSSAPVSIPFQVTNCASLKFEPKFTVSTSGKTSRANGASLHVDLTYPSGALGKDANIAKVKVDLPKQLPSRLTTLQKACTAATFEANPASCPVDSRVGQAKAITPLLPVPLEGPAYFVSHGGAKFPELIVVLQGYGVTLDLHGETFISKAGITSSTFHTVPDAPVGSFELTLPEGPDSALAANGNLCKSTLKMPTAFVGQNGAEIHESTKIGVTGCPKAVRHERKKPHQKKRRK
jgi:hypothetical protein